MKKNEKENNVQSSGISTKSYKAPVKKSNSENPEETFFESKRKISTSAIIAIVVISLAVMATVGIIIYFIVDNHEKNFDYFKYDLSGYVGISDKDYSGFDLKLDIAKPHTKRDDGTGVSDLEISLAAMIYEKVSSGTIGGLTADPTVIAIGDDIYFWYRAYILDGEKEIDITSFSNFYKSESNIIADENLVAVGKGSFALAGVETALIGKNIGDYAKFVKITEGKVAAGQVAYISCERMPVGGKDEDLQLGNAVRIDLADSDTAALWSSILVGKDIGSEIPDFRITIDGVAYDYSKVKVEFVTECEHADNVLTVEAYVPYDSDVTQVRNETVYVDIFPVRIQMRNQWHYSDNTEYNLYTDLTEAFVQNKIDDTSNELTLEKLNGYDGATLVERFEKYVQAQILSNYNENLKDMTEDYLWQHYLDTATIKRYPTVKVDKVYREYYDDLNYQYTSSGGTIYDYFTGSNVTCETIDEYAIVYYGLKYAENQDYVSYLTEMAQSMIKERLVLYYVLSRAGILPDDETLALKIQDLKDEYLEEYVKQDTATDTSEYTEEEYEAYLDECRKKISSYYTNEYFAETACYDILVTQLLSNIGRVLTLDDAPAYQRVN